MKAITLKGFGGVETLVISDVPVPEIRDNELLVKVTSIGINPVDIKTRQGKGLASQLNEFNPIILGWDISGIVKRKGYSVTKFKEGDEVFGMVNFPGHGKAYAEYVAVSEDHIAFKPANIKHAEAAGASLAALTAWQIIKEKADVKQGDKVLIHAAAGGVGHFAVQMAVWLGADVTGTSSAKNCEFVLNLGASRCIDYENELFENIVHDQDLVIDTIGGDYIDRSLKTLKPGGKIISIPTATNEGVEEKAKEKGFQGLRFRVKSDGKNMAEIAELLHLGIIKTHIFREYDFDDFRSAHLQIETKKTIGKIVLNIE